MNVHELLPAFARPAIERALRKPLSYSVRYLVAPGPQPRAVVILGEAHVKLAEASKLGREVVKCFELRGVETFQRRDVFGGRLLGFLINAPRIVLRALSLGSVRGSTITDAKEIDTGHTFELEKTPNNEVPLPLHVASVYLVALFGTFYSSVLLTVVGLVFPWLLAIAFLFQLHLILLVPAYFWRRHAWSWMIHPAVALINVRDALMAEGTVRMLREHPKPTAAVVVMGRAHVSGYERELVEKHGFVRAEL